MKIKTSNLTGLALDWAVCEATGMLAAYTQFRSGKAFRKVWGVAKNTHLHPSTDWAQGGPIIEREKIELGWVVDHWQASKAHNYRKSFHGSDPQHPLIAAMRCFVTSKLGDEVEIPKEMK